MSCPEGQGGMRAVEKGPNRAEKGLQYYDRFGNTVENAIWCDFKVVGCDFLVISNSSPFLFLSWRCFFYIFIKLDRLAGLGKC